MTEPTKLSCPKCGESDRLSTTERLIGLALCEIYDNDRIEYEGSTEILWDTSETIGITCSCGWEYEGDDWINQLTKEK